MRSHPASRPLAAPPPFVRPLQEWAQRLFLLLVVVTAGIVIGTQYVHPDKRVLAVSAAVVVVGIAWRMSMVQGIGLLMFALLYPRGTVFGNTNFALVLLLLVLWLARMALRQVPTPARTPVDGIVGGFLLSFVISFYNVEPGNLGGAFANFQVLVASMAVFYLIVNTIHTERHLVRFHVFQLVAVTGACLVAIYELNHPGGTLIPGWINFEGTRGTEFDLHNVRVGGPFHDFELMSEYCAINLLLVAFLLMRASSTSRKVVLTGILVLVAFVLFATVTRGAMMALGAGFLYGLWVIRRRVKLVPLVVVTTLAVAGFLAMNFFVANFTRSGNIISRLSETKFYGGVPDSRVVAWATAWERFLQHPIIGHGPYYSGRTGIRVWYWPHNVYLYIANLVGIVGLFFFLLLLVKLWRMSWPRSDDLRHPSYAHAFLIVANIQLVVFAVDQIKIDYLRNLIYQFQPWILFASIVVAHRIAVGQVPAAVPARR